jgi:hypothetical protein
MNDNGNKLSQDIDTIQNVIDDIGKMKIDASSIKSKWEAYKRIAVIKEKAVNKIKIILDDLLSNKYTQNTTDSTEKKFKDVLTSGSTEPSDKDSIKNFSIELNKLIREVNTDKTGKYDNIKNNDAYKKFFASSYQVTLKEVDDTPNPTSPTKQKLIIEEFDNYKNFINEVGVAYNIAVAGLYTTEEIRQLTSYVSTPDGLDLFKKDIMLLKDTIVNTYTKIETTILNVAKKYGEMDTRIKKDVLEKIKPTDIAKGKAFDISSTLEKIIQLIDADTTIIKSTFPSIRGGRKKVIGGSQQEDRLKNDKELNKLLENIDGFRKIAEILYKQLTRFSTPETGDANAGENSIFNKLYEQYIIEKEDKENGGDFVATTHLIDKMKANDVYPDDVLEIDMRDKFVFIAVTLFMRIISILIIDLIIDRKLVTRLDSAIFWYGIIMTSILIVFVIIVNYDSYKLRIIFNYVNFHIGYSTTFAYISQLWIFGGMVYYIMLNINDNIITSATNDEERARLKHKVQVVSMITWIFLSLGVLVM